LADIFVDPLNIIPVAKVSKLAGGLVKEGAEVLAKEIPAVQKIGEMLGKAFITRFGQREEFKTLDIARKIEQELQYPGEIRVTIIRETRITEYAR